MHARRSAAIFAGLLLIAGTGLVWAQDTARQEATHRRQVLESLPADAAQVLFGRESGPASGPPQAIGTYTRGCLDGAAQMPADGPQWEVMRPSRNRAWGHPALLAALRRLAAAAAAIGWPGLLIGDIAQPRGGPMLTGHASHQLGIEADVWLTPMPQRRLTLSERDEMPAQDLVAANGLDVDPRVWRPEHRKLLETAANLPGVERIFVNAAIKRAMCREGGADRGWLRRIRPWWEHRRHFHLRLACPADDPQCHNPVPPPPPGDGCDALDWWFTPEVLTPHAVPPVAKPIPLSSLPAACAPLVR